MILEGHNLGQRHEDFNGRVSEAVARQTNFEEVKATPENCDVDKLFKIELASKYKNIEYILEVLGCGDVFYITRALKSAWMYTDEYSQFINTQYLENNIFPNMSKKMKRKMLTAISMHVRNADRAIDFYKYCKDMKLNENAIKFLLFTSDSFKLDLIKTKQISSFRDIKLFKQFIGNSFELAHAYLGVHNYSTSIIQDLRFLYLVSEEEYLNILERIKTDSTYPNFSERFGIRLSKHIITKHKQRVLNKPLLYVNILHNGMVEKYLTIEDVESIAPGLLPEYPRIYWDMNFYKKYKFVLKKIPENKIYGCMKEIYEKKYGNVEFEMCIDFYTLKYYEMLNIDEREAWALRHIDRDKELPGIKNYIWYKFVCFSKADSAIKRYIFLTPDKDERSRIVNIFPETARNKEDLIQILNYYYVRHVNESESHKESFLKKIVEIHDIYSFNNECWTIFDKLLHSLEVYTTAPRVLWEYKFISLVYHVLHNMDMPDVLKEYFDYVNEFSVSYVGSLIERLNEEKKASVASYFLNICTEQIESLMRHPDYNVILNEKDDRQDDHYNIKYKIMGLVSKVWSIIHTFNRSDEDCPAVVVQFVEANMDYYQHHEKYKIDEKKSEEDFVRWLKQDINIALDGISEIRYNTFRWEFRLCRLFRKLKVYFANDVAKEYLDYFMDYLSDVPEGRREYRNIKMAVVGVFYLAGPESIISFVEKYVPTSAKIDHKNIDNRVLQLQKAICRLAYHPRPPLPLSIFQKYITGDYVHYCLPTFYNYFASLPSTAKFIDRLLDAPLSIQKHGLRLAFRSYDPESLSPIIISAWKKTKNVSLRMVLYETLFNRILEENYEGQKKLYEVLKIYTLDLNHDDQETVFSLLVNSNFPNAFKGDFIETAWITVNNLSDKSVDIKRRVNIIRYMERYIDLVKRDFPRLQIIDAHVKDMLCEKNIIQDRECFIHELIDAKWQLTAKYIVTYNDEVQLQKSLELMQMIMTECLQSWNLVKRDTYTVRKFLDEFIKTIMAKDPKTIESCGTIVAIYQCVLDSFTSFLKKEEMYLWNWKLQLSLKCRNLIHNGMETESHDAGKRQRMSSNQTIMGHAYGRIVAEMVENGVKSDEFYRCLYDSIADIVNNVGGTICHILGINSNGFVYYICESLIETKLSETHLLALFMLPRDPPYAWGSEHRDIVKQIQDQSVSKEVRSYLYKKYVLSDYQVRRYVE